jgi:prepilin-type N-terminal cleavage/methylation domain-containing protein
MRQHNNATLRGGPADILRGGSPYPPREVPRRLPGARWVRRPTARSANHLSRQCARPGFSLVEVVVSTLIVAILLVASLTVLGASRAGQLKIADRARGEQLATQLMNEILLGDYLEPDDPPLFGPEGNEIGKGRMYFDDVDDYAGWTESPLQTRGGVPLPDFDGWKRSVTVEWVSPNNLTQASASPTDLKRITVTVERGIVPVARIIAFRSSGWAQAVPKYQDATGNRPPRAVAWTASSTAKVNTVVSFDGRNSIDPNGDALSYAWNFGDNTTATGSTAGRAYAAAGTYTITLTVRDGRGGVDTDRLLITVTP